MLKYIEWRFSYCSLGLAFYMHDNVYHAPGGSMIHITVCNIFMLSFVFLSALETDLGEVEKS